MKLYDYKWWKCNLDLSDINLYILIIIWILGLSLYNNIENNIFWYWIGRIWGYIKFYKLFLEFLLLVISKIGIK